MIVLSVDQYTELCGSYGGFCLACESEVSSSIEPDARNYKCDECGANQVFGIEELLLMGEIDFSTECDDAELPS